jgi:hypothetical protein
VGIPTQLFGEWRVKSCIIIAKALAEKGDYRRNNGNSQTAREVIINTQRKGMW